MRGVLEKQVRTFRSSHKVFFVLVIRIAANHWNEYWMEQPRDFLSFQGVNDQIGDQLSNMSDRNSWLKEVE